MPTDYKPTGGKAGKPETGTQEPFETPFTMHVLCINFWSFGTIWLPTVVIIVLDYYYPHALARPMKRQDTLLGLGLFEACKIGRLTKVATNSEVLWLVHEILWLLRKLHANTRPGNHEDLITTAATRQQVLALQKLYFFHIIFSVLRMIRLASPSNSVGHTKNYYKILRLCLA